MNCSLGWRRSWEVSKVPPKRPQSVLKNVQMVRRVSTRQADHSADRKVPGSVTGKAPRSSVALISLSGRSDRLVTIFANAKLLPRSTGLCLSETMCINYGWTNRSTSSISTKSSNPQIGRRMMSGKHGSRTKHFGKLVSHAHSYFTRM